MASNFLARVIALEQRVSTTRSRSLRTWSASLTDAELDLLMSTAEATEMLGDAEVVAVLTAEEVAAIDRLYQKAEGDQPLAADDVAAIATKVVLLMAKG